MAAETEELEPRAWVGCLACYNGGRLVGAWMDGAEADDRDRFEGLVEDLGEGRPSSGHSRAHEELWVMDHEGYGGLLAGECSPSEAARLAEAIAGIQGDGLPVGAVAAWLANTGEKLEEWDGPTSEGFGEAYGGEYDSEADYAEELAGEILEGFEDRSGTWPWSCLDWERAWRELELGGDNWSADAPGGVWIFRSV